MARIPQISIDGDTPPRARINPVHDTPDPSGTGTKLQLIADLANATDEQLPALLQALRSKIYDQKIAARIQTLQNHMAKRDQLHDQLRAASTEEQAVLRGNLGIYMALIDTDRKYLNSALQDQSESKARGTDRAQ